MQTQCSKLQNLLNCLHLGLDHGLNRGIAILYPTIGLDKSGYQVNIFLFLHGNIYCGYSLEAREALLMSTHNICFHGEIGQISML